MTPDGLEISEHRMALGASWRFNYSRFCIDVSHLTLEVYVN